MPTPASTAATYAPSLTSYTISLETYLSANPGLTNLVVSAIITHRNRILVIQRAAHDGFPLKWEVPGGSVDSTDATILDALFREVLEETGLLVTQVWDVAEILEFDGSRDTKWRKLTFLVSVDDHGLEDDIPCVCLNAEEHVDAVWVAEEDVLAAKAGGREINFAYATQRQLLLDCFSRLQSS